MDPGNEKRHGCTHVKEYTHTHTHTYTHTHTHQHTHPHTHTHHHHQHTNRQPRSRAQRLYHILVPQTPTHQPTHTHTKTSFPNNPPFSSTSPTKTFTLHNTVPPSLHRASCKDSKMAQCFRTIQI